MPKISDEQLEEYEQLKKWARRERVFQSAKEITRLEDDIDAPIKNCVGMFALLGCFPVYSCCGFDYSGQPFHKSHQYGRPYFILKASQRVDDVLLILSKQKTFWYATPNGKFVNLEAMAGMNPYWRMEECIHFAEECVILIGWMENFLRRCSRSMMDEIVLEDTNYKAKQDLRFWQYPPKEPWIVRKSDFFNEKNDE